MKPRLEGPPSCSHILPGSPRTLRWKRKGRQRSRRGIGMFCKELREYRSLFWEDDLNVREILAPALENGLTSPSLTKVY